MRLLPIVLLSGAALLFAGQAHAEGAYREMFKPFDDPVVIARVKRIVSGQMKDPDSTQFKDIRTFYTAGKLDVVCGSVNAKNSYGGYVGFRRFVVAGGMPFVRDAEHAAEQKAFDDVWNHYCAAL